MFSGLKRDQEKEEDMMIEGAGKYFLRRIF